MTFTILFSMELELMRYTHLLTCVVHAHQMSLALVGGTNIAIALRVGDFGHATLEVLCIFFYCFAEKGVLQISLTLEDPFGISTISSMQSFPLKNRITSFRGLECSKRLLCYTSLFIGQIYKWERCLCAEKKSAHKHRCKPPLN